jgi:hypothetical protein
MLVVYLEMPVVASKDERWGLTWVELKALLLESVKAGQLEAKMVICLASGTVAETELMLAESSAQAMARQWEFGSVDHWAVQKAYWKVY